jgi:RimJ/RimL family protein N-acetyltransferase
VGENLLTGGFLPVLFVRGGIRLVEGEDKGEVKMARIEPVFMTDKRGREVRICTARPEDAGGVLAVARSVMEEEIYLLTTLDEFTVTKEEEARILAEFEESPDRLFLVAECGGQIVGTLNAMRGRMKRRYSHVVRLGMGLIRDFRGCGIGTALLETLLHWAEEHPDIEKVQLEVFSTNDRAISLYRKMGFTEEGRLRKQIKFGENDYADEVIMGRFVKGERMKP